MHPLCGRPAKPSEQHLGIASSSCIHGNLHERLGKPFQVRLLECLLCVSQQDAYFPTRSGCGPHYLALGGEDSPPRLLRRIPASQELLNNILYSFRTTSISEGLSKPLCPARTQTYWTKGTPLYSMYPHL